MVLSLLNHAAESSAEEFIEGWGKYSPELVIVVLIHEHLDPLEEDLVEHAPDMFGCAAVGCSAMYGKVDGHVDIAGCIAEVCGEVFELPVHSYKFCVEALLLGGEHIHWDRVVVVCFEELALLSFNLELLRSEHFRLHRGVLHDELKLSDERLA